MYYWLFFFTMQRPVEFICWNSDSKCFHGEVSTHRPCLKRTLPSALTVLWKKLKKMTWEEEKWRSRVVLLGTKCGNLLGDKTRRCGCLCLRGGSKEGRIWAPTVWLKAMGTSLTSDGCSSWGSREDWLGSVKRKATCYYERQLSLKQGHIQQAELCYGITWSTLCCPLPPGKRIVHPSGFQTQSPSRK